MSTFKENYGIYKKFRPLYEKGLNDSEIARELGCNNATVTHWRNKEGLESNYKKDGTNEEKILDLYDEGLSKAEIVEEGPSPYKYTMSVLSHLPDQNKYPEISSSQKARIVGTLLGDATVNSRKTLSFKHKREHKEYVIHKAEEIGLSYNYRDSSRMWKGKENLATTAFFHVHPYIKNLRGIFYPNGKKIFPRKYLENIFNWESLAYWYMDDGSKETSGGLKIAIFNLSRQAYEISNFLYRNLNLDLNIQYGGNTLYIPVNQKEYFIKNIKNYVPKCMRYKIESD